jgi:hypothetical protein
VRDRGAPGLVACETRDQIAAGRLPGPRVLAAGPPITTPDGHQHWCGLHATGPDAVREAVRGLCAASVDLIKIVAQRAGT